LEFSFILDLTFEAFSFWILSLYCWAPFEDDGHLLSLRTGVVPVRESVGEEVVVAGVLL
jgi:hypothetical protein